MGIRSKVQTKAWDDNYDRIFRKASCAICGATDTPLCGHDDSRDENLNYTGKYYCREHCPTGTCKQVEVKK